MSLPPRGTGLRTGRARPRSYPPLTDEQRRVRHYGLGNGDEGLWISAGALIIGSVLCILAGLSK